MDHDEQFVATLAAIIMSGNHTPDAIRVKQSVAAARAIIAEVAATEPKEKT
jgi:hypothetical protein